MSTPQNIEGTVYFLEFIYDRSPGLKESTQEREAREIDKESQLYSNEEELDSVYRPIGYYLVKR